MTSAINLASSLLTSSAALWRGTRARPAAVRPAQPLQLYEMENCPYCRLVREVLTELDLDAVIYPCPKGGTRFRPKSIELGGKAQYPFLVDPNNETRLYESADIIKYLYDTYAQRQPPSTLRIKLVDTPSSMVASGLRITGGLQARPSKPAEKMLELWSFESSPYARPVRELLCALELPYLLHNIGKAQWQDFVLTRQREMLWPDFEHKGAGRQALKVRAGKVMVPYLEDPNTGAKLFESAAILRYLQQTYAA